MKPDAQYRQPPEDRADQRASTRTRHVHRMAQDAPKRSACTIPRPHLTTAAGQAHSSRKRSRPRARPSQTDSRQRRAPPAARRSSRPRASTKTRHVHRMAQDAPKRSACTIPRPHLPTAAGQARSSQERGRPKSQPAKTKERPSKSV